MYVKDESTENSRRGSGTAGFNAEDSSMSDEKCEGNQERGIRAAQDLAKAL